MILGANGEKMSKSRGNVINPDDIVKSNGADSLRLFEMFAGPLNEAKPWSTTALDGSTRFIERVFRLVDEESFAKKIVDNNDGELDYSYHFLVKKVTSDFLALSFNTAIAQMMVFINDCYKAKSLYRPYIENFVKMFSCICPFVGEEMWQKLGHDHSIAYESWPIFDESKLIKKDVTIGVSINGKVRDSITLNKTATQEEAVKSALSSEKVRKWTDGKAIRKVIYVPGRILNILVG